MRSTLALAFALSLVLAVVPLPVAAHVNHVSADAQVSADGTLVAETAFIAADGYLVVHRDDGGEIGEPIGHVPISQQGGLKTDVRVPVEPEVWADWSTQDVWLVLHNSDGDGGFEPGEDSVVETFGSPASAQITVAKGDPALVTAESFAPQRLNDSYTSVRIRNVTLPSDGAVEIRNGSDGQVLGRTNLSAGPHQNVTVAVNESFLESNSLFAAAAVLVDASGEPVPVDGTSVETVFGIRYRAADDQSTPTPAVVQTATATPGGDDEAGSDSATGDSKPADDAGGSATDVDGSGFGVVTALAALAALALLGRSWV